MRKFLILILFGIIPILSCTDITRKSTISGTVTGADGNVPPIAHVHLIKLGDNPSQALKFEPLHPDGSFNLELEKGQYYELLFTAVNHTPVKIPLLINEKNQTIKVNVILAAYDYKDDLNDVKITGDWNRFSFRSAELMSLQDDGTFVYERDVKADTLAYQLLNIENDGHSVNGTMSDYYKYDGGGDYYSIVRVTNGKVKIIFDPSKLLKSKYQDLPRIAFDEQHKSLNDFILIANRFEKERGNAIKAIREYKDEHGTTQDFKYDFSELKKYYLEKMSDKDNEILQKFAAIHLADLAFLGADIDSTTLRQITEMVPIDDPIWVAKFYVVGDVFNYALGENEATKLFGNSLSFIPSKKVQAAVLIDMGMKAKRSNDTDKLKKIYNNLKSNYGDVQELRYYIMQLNPDKRIAKGKHVPDFEVKLTGSNQKVSNKTLSGKFYLMDFWAVWCNPCLGEMPTLHIAYNKFKNENFTILSLSFDQKEEDVIKFRKNKWKMPWLHSFIEDGFNNELAKKFEITGIPKPILVNPNGTIIATDGELRGAALSKTLSRFLYQ